MGPHVGKVYVVGAGLSGKALLAPPGPASGADRQDLIRSAPAVMLVKLIYPTCAEPSLVSSLASHSTTALAFLAPRPMLKLRP